MKELTEKLIPMYRALRQAIEEEIVASAHAISRGGLGVHLAQVAFAGGFGMDIDLRKVPTAKIDRNDQILYSESAGRFIVTVTPEDKERFEQLLEKAEYGCIGKTTNDENLKIRGVNGEELINISIYELKEAWQRTFGELI
jgi:phosphoribosylformylglycinamidine synthase